VLSSPQVQTLTNASFVAGQEMIVEMHQQPNQRECTTEAIGGAHYGPVLVYMSAVSDATTADGSSSWFKVAEDGYDVATKTWGTMNLNTNCGKQTFTVPADIAPGNYLVRAEAIALHSAGSSGGAQMYMTCFQVNVSGTGTAVPEGVLFPGAYSATDPGILINIYQTITEYIIPGPAVYTAGGASGAASSAAAPASSGSTSSVVSVSTSAAASSSVAVVRVSSASVSSSVAAISVSSAPASSSVAAIAIPTSTPVISATVIAVPTTLQTIVKSTTSSSAPVITSAAENYDSCE
jgi:cellulase